MHIGDLLANGQISLTPWMPRQGDNAIFTYEIIGISGTPTGTGLDVKVLHKDTEDPGEGAEITTSFGAIDSSDFYSDQVGGLKEMVRFKVEGKATAGVYYRILPTTWFDTAKA